MADNWIQGMNRCTGPSPCHCSITGPHQPDNALCPRNNASGVTSEYDFSRSDALLTECKETVARFDAAKEQALEACPFCGSDAAKITEDHGTYEPGCTHCGTYIGQYSSARSAAAAWNRRA
jgi:hypothetical protein